jgi:hypothetical protein
MEDGCKSFVTNPSAAAFAALADPGAQPRAAPVEKSRISSGIQRPKTLYKRVPFPYLRFSRRTRKSTNAANAGLG